MTTFDKIMIVDDDIDDQLLLEIGIRKAGYINEILYFNDGAKALAYLEKPSSNSMLTLCDIDMPIMDGFLFREAICKDKQLKNRCAPFIFMSAFNDPSIIIKAYLSGPQGYFTKANNYQDLLKITEGIVKYWNFCSVPVAS